jgi:hypothetical protein
LLPQMPSRTRA